MYLRKIEWAYDYPTHAYAHNNVCVGLKGILDSHKMEKDVREKLTNYYDKFQELSFYNPFTHQIDKGRFREFNCLLWELKEYLNKFDL